MSDLSSNRSLQHKLADLHIFVVPMELWLDKYRTAFNNIALESVSAGFVRVHPELNLHQLRECFEEQLGEEVIPENYIYLRSVGRCMAVVKENQEHLLKVADFLPPIAYSPEIFLLPGLHETYARPASDNVVIATQGHTTAGMSTTNQFHLPMITQQYATNQHLTTQPNYNYEQDHHDNTKEQDNFYKQDYHSNRQKEIGQQGYDSSFNDGSVRSVPPNKPKKTKTRRDSFEDEHNGRYDNPEKFPSGDYGNGYHGESEHRSSGENQDIGLSPRSQKKDFVKVKNKKNKSQKSIKSETQKKTVKIIQPEVVHTLSVPGPDGYFISPPTPIPSGRVIATPVPGPRRDHDSQNNTTKESSKDSKTHKGVKKKHKGRSRSPSQERESKAKATNNEDPQKSDSGPSQDYIVPSYENIEERSKYAQFPSPAKSTRARHTLYESEIDSGIADDLVTPPQGLDDSFGRSKADTFKRYDREHTTGRDDSRIAEYGEQGSGQGETGNHGNEMGNHGNETVVSPAKTEQLGELNKNKDDTKGKKEPKEGKDNTGKDGKTSTKTKPKKTVKKTARKADDLDEKINNLKAVEPPPLKVAELGDISFERDTQSAKDTKQKLVEELRGQLRKTKHDRVELEKQRDQKVRRAKSLQTQTLQKRNQSKNIWKKKFFDEKRKTAPLEEHLNRLRYEVEAQHKVILSYLETTKDRDGNKSLQEHETNPSEKTNQLMILARLQNEVEDLKHRVEEIKTKLASEMKLRDNAQSELKQLREDLLDKKINVTLTKSQKSLLLLGNQENITAQ